MSIDKEILSSYLSDLPTDKRGRYVFEVVENPIPQQHEKISHFLKPLTDGRKQ